MEERKRELLIGGVNLVKGRVKDVGKAMLAICDQFEPEFEETRFLEDAPFDVVSLLLRFGTKWGTPSIGKVNKRYFELEVGIEVPLDELKVMNYESLESVVRKVTLESLLVVAEQFGLESSRWSELLESDV